MRLEQSPLPEGAARCSSGMAGVLELEGRGPEHIVPSRHMCDDQLLFDTEILTVLPELEKCKDQAVGRRSPWATKAPQRLATSPWPKEAEEQKRPGDAK